MSNRRALYEQVILDHNKSPRNFGDMEDADHEADGYNALCGDQFHVSIKMDGDSISDVRFNGAGCAISKSSASIMTTMLIGKTREEAERQFASFHAMITAEPDTPIEDEALGKLVVFSGVRDFPIRAKCATLAWHTFLSALQGDTDTVSTE